MIRQKQIQLVPHKTVKAKFLGATLVNDFLVVYKFTDIVDLEGRKYSDKCFKETKLLQYAELVPERSYQVLMRAAIFMMPNADIWPGPIYISDGADKYYIQGGNSIIKQDANGVTEDLSEKYSEKLQYKKQLRKDKWGDLDS
jgi:hypothetical protein